MSLFTSAATQSGAAVSMQSDEVVGRVAPRTPHSILPDGARGAARLTARFVVRGDSDRMVATTV